MLSRAAASIVLAGLFAALGCVDRANVERGRSAYESYCVQCHEGDGGIGSRLSREVLGSYGTAAGLLAYNRRYMPYNAEGTLSDREYLDITAYLLQRFDFVEDGRVLTADNGARFPLRRPD